jgi:excinuclease ABC subunit C
LILLPLEIEDRTALAKLLSQKAGHPVELQVPQRGEKKQLLEFAANNAAAGLKAELKSLERRGDHPALVQLTELLALSHRPFRIEGYDISNLMGEAVVASITAFEAAKPKRSDYRRIRIKSLTGHPDDYAAMEEAIYRRFSGSLADRLPVPDLLLIDGGIGQVRAAQKGLQRAQIEIPLVGLAKRSETLILPDGRSLSLPLTAPALQLLIYLRDETHNNGLRFNRKLRSEKTLRSIFDDIPGIGPARKEALLQNFSTLEELYATPLETLAGLPGMNRAAAQAVAEALATRLKSQRAN